MAADRVRIREAVARIMAMKEAPPDTAPPEVHEAWAKLQDRREQDAHVAELRALAEKVGRRRRTR